MASRKTGPILTETRKEVVSGDYVKPSRQAEEQHWDGIEENLRSALSDLGWLFRHADQNDLIEIFGEGAESVAGPVPRVEHTRPTIDEMLDELFGKENSVSSNNGTPPRRALGWKSKDDLKKLSQYVDERGRVVSQDQFPEADTKLERILDELIPSNKASPETQETLIECVAFVCRAAEAGELNVDQLIAHGVERYYRNSTTKNGQMVALQKWAEADYGGILERSHKRGELSKDTTPVPTSATIRYLEREGYDVTPD